MDNRTLVTRHLGRVPSKNHQGSKNLISKFSAAQKFNATSPIRAANTNRTTFANSARDTQKTTRYNALQHADFKSRILWMQRAQISACRACSPICIGYPQLAQVIQEKSRKMLLLIDFKSWSLKSLKKKTAKKLSTACSFGPALPQKPDSLDGLRLSR